jgi:hypothetical protein
MGIDATVKSIRVGNDGRLGMSLRVEIAEATYTPYTSRSCWFMYEYHACDGVDGDWWFGAGHKSKRGVAANRPCVCETTGGNPSDHSPKNRQRTPRRSRCVGDWNLSRCNSRICWDTRPGARDVTSRCWASRRWCVDESDSYLHCDSHVYPRSTAATADHNAVTSV